MVNKINTTTASTGEFFYDQDITFGLVQTLLEHAATVWDPYKDMNIRKIEKVQRQAARFIVRNYEGTASVGAILDELGWKSLQGRRKARKLCMLYKLPYGNLAAGRMLHLIPMQWASTHLKFSNAYKVPYSRTNYHKYLFFSRTIREWNSSLEDTATLPNLDSFSKAVFP